jgi:hypothetical protein
MNTIRILRLGLAAALVLAVAPARVTHAGADRAGTTAANFLTVGSGPRILGMGGATLGLGDDLAGGSYNVAALGWMQQGSFSVAHAGLGDESLQEWLGLGGRIGNAGPRWSVTGLYQGESGIEGRDDTNSPTGTFSAASFAVGVHVAQPLGSMFTVGLGSKWVNEKLADVSGSGLTMDAGLMFRHGMLGAGFAAQNVGGRMKYDGSSYPFPTNYGVGLGVTHPATGLSFALDANFPEAYYADVRSGVEWRWRQTLALRTGYRHTLGGGPEDPLSGMAFGLGAGMNGFWFDYGYLLSGLGETGQHRVALTFFPSLWGGLGSDPFGQGDIPREFGKPRTELIGPPAPKTKK